MLSACTIQHKPFLRMYLHTLEVLRAAVYFIKAFNSFPQPRIQHVCASRNPEIINLLNPFAWHIAKSAETVRLAWRFTQRFAKLWSLHTAFLSGNEQVLSWTADNPGSLTILGDLAYKAAHESLSFHVSKGLQIGNLGNSVRFDRSCIPLREWPLFTSFLAGPPHLESGRTGESSPKVFRDSVFFFPKENAVNTCPFLPVFQLSAFALLKSVFLTEDKHGFSSCFGDLSRERLVQCLGKLSDTLQNHRDGPRCSKCLAKSARRQVDVSIGPENW